MKLIKLGLISVVCLFLLAVGIGALLPSKVLVSRAVNIKVEPGVVVKYVSDIKEWEHWVAGINDPSVKIHSSTAATIGSNEVKIIQVSDTAVISEWKSDQSHLQLSTIRLIYQPQQQVTIVQWQFEQQVGWLPWEKLGTMMNDKIIGTMMEKNLEQLRTYLEAKTGIL